MNLQPVYPAYHPALNLTCAACGKLAPSSTAFADLADKPGTYYCHVCAGIHGRLTLNEKALALEGRDRKELQNYGSLYGSSRNHETR